MTLTDRDRKIALVAIPILLLVAYWFLLLAPKRDEAATAGAKLGEQQQRLDQARASYDQAKGAETDFAADYGEIVRLGKAIPSTLDMPSLLVQLDSAAAGTGIRFTRVATGSRDGTTATPPATTTSTTTSSTTSTTSPSGSSTTDSSTTDSSSSSTSPPVAAGGEQAQSAPGATAESANNTAQTANQQSAAAEQSGVNPSDTQTSTSTGSGLPVGGGTAAAPGGATAAPPAGLETVPLELEFVGNFFNLADFFHDVKRFVRVANQNVVVGGRLVTIEGVRFSSDPELFPKLKAELDATVYLSPKTQGTTAGASPQGPAPATASTPEGTTASTSPATSVAPTATATP